jgi:WD40-like Beta Propeller Repeat
VRVLASVFALIALVSGSSGSAARTATCPRDASLGTVRFPRGDSWYAVSLTTCAARKTARAPAQSSTLPSVRTSPVRSPVQRIWVHGRLVFTHAENGPIRLLMLSGDGRWVFFAVDPYASGSIAADGLDVLVVSTQGGPVHHLGMTLVYPDYLTWCGGRLVYAEGADRIAIHAKRLLTAGPPDWHPRSLWNDRRLSFASPACTTDGTAVAVLVQPSSVDARFFDTRWRLWRVGLDGSRRLLDTPPPGWADEAPQWSGDGRSLLFVRERNGYGRIMLLQDGTVYGPIASLGYNLGFYGHHDWEIVWRR